MRGIMEDCDVDADVDVRDPDEKSIMTYVAQFLQYSKDLPVAEEDLQVCNVANKRSGFCFEPQNAAAPIPCMKDLDSSFYHGTVQLISCSLSVFGKVN